MRIMLFEQFNNDTSELTLKALQDAYDGNGVTWVEPLSKGKLEFDEDAHDKELLFDVGDKSIAIEFEWSRRVRTGQPGDGRSYPDDPDTSELTGITVHKVELRVDGDLKDSFGPGKVSNAAWLLLYKLLPENRSTKTVREKAARLKTELKWK